MLNLLVMLLEGKYKIGIHTCMYIVHALLRMLFSNGLFGPESQSSCFSGSSAGVHDVVVSSQ